MSESPALFFLLVAAVALLALVAVVMSVRSSRMRRYLHDTPTSPVAGVFVGDVEVQGTAETDGPLQTYLSEMPCVHHAWSIREHWQRWVTETYRDSKGNTRTRQRLESGATTIASGGAQIPFYLRDETGVLLIRPEGASIEPLQTVEFTCGPDHPSYYGKGPAGAVGDSIHRRTFHEDAIPLHRPLFIAGRARERSDLVAAEIAQDADARLFLITVRDERAIGRGYSIAAWVWAVLAMLLALGAAAILQARPGRSIGFDPVPFVVAVLACIAAIGGAWGWMAFNSIVTLRQRVRRAWSNIEVELSRRAELLPNLAAAVQGARLHERDTQQVLAVLRAQAAIAPAEARAAGERVRGVMPVLRAVVEAYPDLTTQANFLALQGELSHTESRIALARSYYNGIAASFNTRLLVVPDRFLAAVARLKPFDLFQATDLERDVPQVQFARSVQEVID